MRFSIYDGPGGTGGGGGGGAPGMSDATAHLHLAGGQTLAAALVALGLEIVRESRGPMRLWDFSRRLGARLRMPPMPLAELCEAVKATLAAIDDPRLRLQAPGMPGAGYVYDAADPDSVPVRSSR